jgi:hypothetical protein
MESLPMVKELGGLPAAAAADLHWFILIGEETLKAHKARIRALEKVSESKAAREAALDDAQKVAEVVVEAEKKMGELLAATVTQGGKSNRSPRGGTSNPLPSGISRKESHRAQTLARYPEIVQKAKEEARAKGELVTGKKVYGEIKNSTESKRPLPLGGDSRGVCRLKDAWKKASPAERELFWEWVTEQRDKKRQMTKP